MKAIFGRVAAVCASAIMSGSTWARAEIVVSETFAGSSVPSGWIMNGRENAPNSLPDSGTAKTPKDWFVSDPTGFFLRLTENGVHQRTTAVYEGNLFRTDQDFTIRMDLRVSGNKNNADGMSFFWLDATSVANIGKTIGGSGEWLGTPRGDVTGTPGSMNDTSSFGFHAGLRGYAFEFDHYSNDPSEPPEYTALVDLGSWTHLAGTITDFSSDPGFYLGNGWQTVEFGYNSAADKYTLSWGYDGSSFNQSKAYPGAGGTERFKSAYFGFGGGTDGLKSDQDVRNVIFRGSAADPVVDPVPEPGTWAAAALLTGGAAFVHWRRRKARCPSVPENRQKTRA